MMSQLTAEAFAPSKEGDDKKKEAAKKKSSSSKKKSSSSSSSSSSSRYHHSDREGVSDGQTFNASDFITHSKEVLDKVDHHHINCVLKSSQLGSSDSHEELKAKHDAIKALASKLRQRAENE
mmetsp:Transcript_12216/g.15577  ORF Transcript_12216/g.15577 Transcript_12216/m.15577 type:complete len:122 (-) Transcript_12216:634-999(-)